ncbi:uncharacterized protein [Primulina eburnea]|uniref:uncharacterized protein isoform X3 n=1 Tax=Primulina eburnea TaxID=1245227 RepID=UPI003C6C4134
MGNEAWRLEQVEEEEETTLLLVRKSKTEKNGSKVSETSTIIHGMNYKVISESDGQAIQSTFTANGSHKEEPDGVFEDEAENLVFFDKVQGLWKCRICSWTYQNGSVCIDHIQNHNGQFHKPMHDKILNFETEGVGHGKMEVSSESDKASEEIESADIDLIDEETEYDVETVLQKQNTHDLYCPNCNSCITGRVILRKRKRNKIQISVKRAKTENPPVQESDDQVHPHHIIGAEEDRDSGPDLFRCLSCFSFFMPTGNGFKFWKFGDKSRKENVRDEQVPRKKSWFPSIFAPHNQNTAIEQDVSRASEPLLGTGKNYDTLECEDKILLSPRHDHSTNDAKMEQHEIVAGYHLKEPIISNDQLEVVSGYYLKEPIISKEPLAVFAGYHLKEPIRGDEEVGVVAGYHLKEPVISKDVQVTHGSDLSVTTLTVDETEIVNEEPAQDAISVSRKGGSNLVIFSNEYGSTTIEKSEEGQIFIQTAQKGSTDAKMEQQEILTGYHLKEPIISNDQFEVVSGYYLKEPIISKEPLAVFAGYHLKEPIRGDEEVGVVAGYHLKEPVISKDVPVTHDSNLLVTTFTVEETEIVNEEPAQDAISVSRKGGSNLVIFSNDGSTTIEKSEEGQILIQTGTGT